jgi:hypothetical protein
MERTHGPAEVMRWPVHVRVYLAGKMAEHRLQRERLRCSEVLDGHATHATPTNDATVTHRMRLGFYVRQP